MNDTRPLADAQSRDPHRRYVADFEATGPGTLAGRYLRMFWQPVYLAEDLKPGKAKRLRVMAEDFTLYRGMGGTPQVLAPRCPHRGTILSAGCVEGDGLRCYYHGWMFDASGQCVDQPAEDPRFKDKVSVRSYPTREYLGLIFAYLGEGEPPPFPRLNVCEEPGYPMASANFRPCSYFCQLENGVDEAHINFVHKISSFAEAGYTREIPEMDSSETDYGIRRGARRGNDVRIGHMLMPNVLLTSAFDRRVGWIQHFAWRVPVEDDSSISYIVDMIGVEGDELAAYLDEHAAREASLTGLTPGNDIGHAVLRGEMTLDEVVDRADLLSIQDVVALVGQQGASRERDLLGRSDQSVALLRRIWARELAALDDGGTTKRWRWPEDVRVTFESAAP